MFKSWTYKTSNGTDQSCDLTGVVCDMMPQASLAPRMLALSLVLLGTAALAGDGINLTITNDGIVDVFVTVYDVSTTPGTTAVEHQRINGFTSIPISVNADATGRGNISWTAVGVDTRDRQCGHGTKSGLANDAEVNVHVDSDCGSW